MKLKCKAAAYLVLCDPCLYKKFVMIEGGVTVLYVELTKALYGQLKAALLFYIKFVTDLIWILFTLNRYDPCVAS